MNLDICIYVCIHIQLFIYFLIYLCYVDIDGKEEAGSAGGLEPRSWRAAVFTGVPVSELSSQLQANIYYIIHTGYYMECNI